MPGVAMTALTGATAGQEVLQCFWDLAALDQDKRIAAVAQLLEHLQEEAGTELAGFTAQDAKDAAAGSGRVDAILQGCGPKTAYVVKRLVKGLASGRAAARQGFSTALAGCLESVPGFGIHRAQALLSATLETTGSMKGNEVRDVLLGHMFGLAAVVRSGLVNTPAEAGEMAERVTALAGKKSFLREAAASILLELTEEVTKGREGQEKAKAVRKMLEGAPLLRGWLSAKPSEATPEALLMAVRLWSLLPKDVMEACPLLPAGVGRLPGDFFTSAHSKRSEAASTAVGAFFSRQHLSALQPVLLATNSAHPRLHLLWPTLLALLIPGFAVNVDEKVGRKETSERKAGDIGEGQLEALWGIVIDGGLFSGVSHERKALGLKLFGLLLPHLRPQHVPVVFCKSFVRCLATNASAAANYLHPAAKRTLERLVEIVKGEGTEGAGDGVRMAIITSLQGVGGSGFDRLTKTKTVARLLEGLGPEGIGSYAQELQQKFLACDVVPLEPKEGAEDEAQEEDEEEQMGDESAETRLTKRQEGHRKWLVDQMCSASHLPLAGWEAKLRVMTFLATHALFDVQKPGKVKVTARAEKVEVQMGVPEVPLSQASRQYCATRLLSLAGAGARQPQGPAARQGGGKSKRQAAEGGKSDADKQPDDNAPTAADLLETTCRFLDGAAKKAATAAGDGSEVAEALGSIMDGEQKMSAAVAAGKLPPWALAQARSLLALFRCLRLYCQSSGLVASADGQPDPAMVLLPAVAADLSACASLAMTFASKSSQPGGAGEKADKKTKWAHQPQYMLDMPPNWSYMLHDCLLVLLRQVWEPLPAAPLRDAAEAVFRAFAESVTWNGFTHLMRVIISGESTEAAEGSDSGSDDDEDGSSDGGDDGTEEEEDEDEEEDKEEEGSDGDSEKSEQGAVGDAEMPDMDDEAMFRLDKVMAAHLRGLQDEKTRRRAEAEARAGFKLRVASLLETYVKRVPGGDILPEAAVHLYEALRKSQEALGSGGAAGGVLQQRLRRVVRLVAASRAEASAAGREAAMSVAEAEGARSVARHCAKAKDRDDVEMGQAVVLYLWRVALSPKRAGSAAEAEAAGCCFSDPSTVVADALALLELFMTKKTCRLKRRFFEQAGNAHLDLRKALMRKASEFATTARSGQLQVEAMALQVSLLRVPKDSRAELGAAVEAMEMQPQWEGQIVHSVCGEWSPAKCQTDGIKQAAAIVRSVTGLGVAPKSWLSAKAVASVEAKASALLGEAGTGKLAGCLRELLKLVGAEARALKTAKAKTAGKSGSKKDGKKGKKKGTARDESDDEEPSGNSDASDSVADVLMSDIEDEGEKPSPPAKGKAKRAGPGKIGKAGSKAKKARPE